jgi:hypothetical protein
VGAPIYLAALLLLKGAKSLTGVLKPFAHLLPNWLPAAEVLSAPGGAGHLLFDWTGGAYPDRILHFGIVWRNRSLSGCRDIR